MTSRSILYTTFVRIWSCYFKPCITWNCDIISLIENTSKNSCTISNMLWRTSDFYREKTQLWWMHVMFWGSQLIYLNKRLGIYILYSHGGTLSISMDWFWYNVMSNTCFQDKNNNIIFEVSTNIITSIRDRSICLWY